MLVLMSIGAFGRKKCWFCASSWSCRSSILCGSVISLLPAQRVMSLENGLPRCGVPSVTTRRTEGFGRK